MLEERRGDKPNGKGKEKRDVELLFLFLFFCMFIFLNAVSTKFVINCTLAEPLLEKRKKCYSIRVSMDFKKKKSA